MRAVLTLLYLILVTCSADVSEKATGIIFKASLKLPGASSNEILAGTGVRVKKIGPVAVKVYALGIYVDRVKALFELSNYRSRDGKYLESSKGFYDDVISRSFEKTLVLKMARTVGTEKMVEALAESVKPRLTSGGMDSLSKFQSILMEAVGKEGAANKGMQFGFVCKRDSLCVSINGKEAGTIKCGKLRNAMLEVYLGNNAVSPTAKASFADGMVRILK